MKALIVEDEPAAVEHLRYLLQEVAPDITVTQVCDTVAGAIERLKSSPPPEVIFSDIELADGRAFRIYEAVEVECPVIFVTAYDAFALRAFRHNGIDYLLKPLIREELERAVKKLRDRKAGSLRAEEARTLIEAARPPGYRSNFLLPFRDQLIPVRAAEIAYFYTEAEVVFARPNDGERRYLVDETLETLDRQLDPNDFFRVSRQFIVSRGAVRAIKSHLNGRFLLRLLPPYEQEVTVSKAKAPAFREWLGAG